MAREKRCHVCSLIKPVYCFSFTQKVCNECLSLRREDKKMEKSANDIYRQLADKRGALIPSDQTLAQAWGMTNGAASGARNRLRQEGYDFKQREDGYWEVTQMPGDVPAVTHYHATEEGIYKIHHEKVDDMPGGTRMQPDLKWSNLQNLVESMAVNEIQRVHFTDKKITIEGQNVAYRYCKNAKKPYTLSTKIVIENETSLWLYIKKIYKNPELWGKEKRHKKE